MIYLQNFLIFSSVITLTQALDDNSDSKAALLENFMRLLVGFLGFVLLLLICVAVHVGHNAFKRYMN